MVLGLLNQLQILIVASDRIPRASNRSLELQHLIFPRLLTEFGFKSMLDLSLMEILVRYLALFLLFSVTVNFGWFWMTNLRKNI